MASEIVPRAEVAGEPLQAHEFFLFRDFVLGLLRLRVI